MKNKAVAKHVTKPNGGLRVVDVDVLLLKLFGKERGEPLTEPVKAPTDAEDAPPTGKQDVTLGGYVGALLGNPAGLDGKLLMAPDKQTRVIRLALAFDNGGCVGLADGDATLVLEIIDKKPVQLWLRTVIRYLLAPETIDEPEVVENLKDLYGVKAAEGPGAQEEEQLPV